MKQRIKYFDYLRVAATFAVVMLHTSGAWFTETQIESASWYISVIYNGATRWAVPVFIMISGAIFLDRDIPLKNLIQKNIFKIITAFVFWSFIYAIITDPEANIRGLIVNILYGHYHMWFLYMIIGLYLLVPVLRKLTMYMDVIKYFLILCLIFTVLIPQIIDVANCFSGTGQVLGEIVHTVVGKLKISLSYGFVGYFIAGFYLNKLDISQQNRRVIYILGVVGYIFTIGCTIVLCHLTNATNELFFGSFTINIVLFASAVFIYGKYELDSIDTPKKIDNKIQKMAEYSMGAYLVHALVLKIVMDFLQYKGTLLSEVIAIPVISLLVFGISMGISAILHRIPFINKYIV